jgi:thiol peroxidase
MSRQGAVTFKGAPLTLAGQALTVGQPAPNFTLHRFADGRMQAVTLKDLIGKPSIISIVPSLDTGVCQIQTKKFNEQLAGLSGKVNAVTVSLDLPFAQNRFCGAENIVNMLTLSDYQERRFGQDWGMLIEELKILARGVVVLDAQGKVVYSELVPEVTQEPNYDKALAALKQQAG